MRVYINTKKGTKFVSVVLGVVATVIAVVCFAVRITPQIFAHSREAALTAAGFIMPGGAAELIKTGYSQYDYDDNGNLDIRDFSSDIPDESSSQVSSNPEPHNEYHSDSQPINSQNSSLPVPETGLGIPYPIRELKVPNSGVQLGNIFVKNANTNHKVDIAEELKKRPSIKIKKDGTPQVLIYHTHTTESYMKEQKPFYYSSIPTRNLDNTRNMVLVGNAIEAQLKAAGIGVVHDTTCHDYPAYNGSYTRSAQTIKKNLKKYPTIQVTLDIHRDAMTASDGTRLKPTVTINGKKAAQIMVLSGCDDDGTYGFPNWEYNLRLAMRLQKSLSDLYPELCRPLYFCPSKYNMNLTKGSLLVEFGTEVNTFTEATYSGELFGKSLVQVLNNLT